MTLAQPVLAAGLVPALRGFVMSTKLHPVLVNFTAALIPVSFFSDLVGRVFKSESLRSTGWWTMLYALLVTPFTIVTGWLFWMTDDNGAAGMAIHKWLGTAFIVPLVAVFLWRWSLHRRKAWPPLGYFVILAIVVAALAYQGHLGGTQVFSGM